MKRALILVGMALMLTPTSLSAADSGATPAELPGDIEGLTALGDPASLLDGPRRAAGDDGVVRYVLRDDAESGPIESEEGETSSDDESWESEWNPFAGCGGHCYLAGGDDGYGNNWLCDQSECDVHGRPGFAPAAAVRFGWWGIGTGGSETRTGLYESLDSSPFWDVDGIWSDGYRTVDFFASGLTNEANQVGVKFYGPTTKAEFGFQRYLRRYVHDPVDNFLGVFEQAPRYGAPFDFLGPQLRGTLDTPGSLNRAFVSQDLNVGADYAIRVEQLEGAIEGRLTRNVKYRVRVWGMRKFGERQAFGASHCFGGTLAAPGVPAPNAGFAPGTGARSCHVVSQRQTIDWLTEEIAPSFEGVWGPLSVEYTQVVRAFYQDDLPLTRYYTSGTNERNSRRAMGFNVAGAAGVPANRIYGLEGILADYSAVPENLTNIGKLKVGWKLSDRRDLYAIGMAGVMNNKYRKIDRTISGFDLRYTDRSIQGWNTVAYAKMYSQNNEDPGFTRWDELGPPPPGSSANQIINAAGVAAAGQPFWNGATGEGFDRFIWDYTRTSAGLKTTWRPQALSGAFRVTGGYDFTSWDRRSDTVEANVPTSDPTDPDVKESEEFTVGATTHHSIHARARMQWTYDTDSYLDYTHRWIHSPMFAVHEPNGVTNTGLPTDEDLIRIGASYYPVSNMLVNVMFGLEHRANGSIYANFAEDNYPTMCTVWYAPTDDWSFTVAYTHFSNWVDQNITLGDQIGGLSGAGPTGRIYLTPVTERFNYGGRANLVSLSSSYRVRPDVALSGGAEWMGGKDVFDSPAMWPDLPTFSDVRVETLRLSAGVDWPLFGWFPAYVRYIYYDYNDKSQPFLSGTANMVLAGGTFTH